MEKILGNSWKNYTKNITPLVLGNLIVMLIAGLIIGAILLLWGVSLFYIGLSTSLVIFDIVVSILLLLQIQPFIYGYIYFVKQIRTKKNVKLGTIFEGSKKYWLRSIGQTILNFLIMGSILTLVTLPFIPIFINTSIDGITVLFSFVGFVVVVLLAITLVSFILMYWVYAIVIDDVGVFEGLERGYKVWRNNIASSFIVYIVIGAISFFLLQLGILSILVWILVGPYPVALLTEAYYALRK